MILPDDDDDTPACCGSVPVSEDGVPVPDEESLVLGDDSPAVVVDDLSSSRRLHADGFSSSLTGGGIALGTAEAI